MKRETQAAEGEQLRANIERTIRFLEHIATLAQFEVAEGAWDAAAEHLFHGIGELRPRLRRLEPAAAARAPGSDGDLQVRRMRRGWMPFSPGSERDQVLELSDIVHFMHNLGHIACIARLELDEGAPDRAAKHILRGIDELRPGLARLAPAAARASAA